MSSDEGPGSLDESLDLFYGEASPNLARIYARVTGLANRSGLSLTGFIRGPICEYGRTLPTNTTLVELGPGESRLAEAVVPDPCFWSPDVPSRYLVQVELRRDGETVETVKRELALRAFGPRGKFLFQEGKRWVIRGVETVSASPGQLVEWRDAAAAMTIRSPSDDLCREATLLGVFLVARVGGSPAAALAELRRLAQWGAVAVAIVETSGISASDMRSAAPNLVLAQPLSAEPQPFAPAPWAQVVVADVDEPARFVARVKGLSLPVIALRRLSSPLSISEARATCDLLQRDLAPHRDFAGYVV